MDSKINWSALGWNILSTAIAAALGALVHGISGGDTTATVGTMAGGVAVAHALPSPWSKPQQ